MAQTVASQAVSRWLSLRRRSETLALLFTRVRRACALLCANMRSTFKPTANAGQCRLVELQKIIDIDAPALPAQCSNIPIHGAGR